MRKAREFTRSVAWRKRGPHGCNVSRDCRREHGKNPVGEIAQLPFTPTANETAFHSTKEILTTLSARASATFARDNKASFFSLQTRAQRSSRRRFSADGGSDRGSSSYDLRELLF